MTLLAVLVALTVYVGFVQSAHRARLQLEKSVSQLRVESVRLNRSAEEIGRLRALPMPAQPGSAPDLRALMQSKINSAGIGPSLRSIDVLDAGQVRVTFGAVPFADWLAWVEALQAQQIRLDTVRIESLTTPGLTSVTATFVRPRP